MRFCRFLGLARLNDRKNPASNGYSTSIFSNPGLSLLLTVNLEREDRQNHILDEQFHRTNKLQYRQDLRMRRIRWSLPQVLLQFSHL